MKLELRLKEREVTRRKRGTNKGRNTMSIKMKGLEAIG
jgi:hypothetical protein